jgi:MFS family permease
LIVFAFDHGGTRMVGVISLIQLIPAAIIAPFGSALGDRFRRERVLLLAEAGIALTSALTAAAAIGGAPPAVVYASGCSVGYVLTLVRPTHGALLPWIARDPAELTSAYTASGLVESSCVLLGPALVTAAFALATALDVSGPGVAYAALALLLIVGTIAIARIRVDRVPEEPAPDGRGTKLVTELGAGFRYVWSDPRPRLIVGLLGLGAFVLGFVDALIVVIAFDLLEGGQTQVGLLNSALGVGGIVGATIALVAGSRERLFPAFRAGILTYGSSLLATAALPAAAPALLAASGAGGTLGDISGRTMLQRLIPDEKLTRSFGVLESAYMWWEGIGAFIGASLTVAFGPRWTLLVAGSLLPVSGFAVRRKLRGVDVGARVPADDLALLRRTHIFEPLPPPALERVARNCVPLDVPAGATVIRQGDVGDRFYVVAVGELIVSVGDREVDRHGPGGYVGEIALLRDVPRTATVTAAAQTRLLSLERDEFLRAVTGHAPAREAADAVAAERIRHLREANPD